MNKTNPLSCTIANRTITVTPETSRAFRVQAGTGTAANTPGTHLDPARKGGRTQQTDDAITTRGGTLRLSHGGRHLVLLDAEDRRLLALYPHRHHIELRSARAGLCYGGADATPTPATADAALGKRLTRHKALKPHVGNGVSVVPWLWHTGGWALLLLTEDGPGSIRWLDKKGRGFKISNTRSATDLVVMPAADMASALQALGELTGFAPVPPLWALGFLHSRWGYRDADEIRRTQETFRAHKHPVDAFIYDFEWCIPRPDYGFKAHGRKTFADFAWNPRLFPDPVEDMAEARRHGIRTIGIRKPRLANTFLLRKAGKCGWRLKDWKRIKGKWAPLHDAISSRVIDFRVPEVRAWYWRRNRRFIEDGMAGWWNDEGEQFPTLYYWWNRAQADGQAQDFPNTRFWSINRSYSMGLARTGAAVWTGDSKTRWKDLRIEVYKTLNYGIAGMPWTACDLGGFSGDPTPELMARYMQMGVFFPIMRTHSCCENKARVPWGFGPDAETAIRKALEWRYRLLPYINSLAHETAETGKPLARPMVLEFPGKPFQEECEQWMFGPSILAAPVLDRGGKRKVTLPGGTTWYDLATGAPCKGGRTLELKCGLEDLPAWQRGGSVLPLAPVLQHTGELAGRPLELRVATGANADFRQVEDDGESLDYRRGRKLVTRWRWNEKTRTLRGRVTGEYAGMPKRRAWTLRFLGVGPVSTVLINGKPLHKARTPGKPGSRTWYVEDDTTLVVTTGQVGSADGLTVTLR